MSGGFPFRSVQPVGLDEALLLRDGFQHTNGTLGANNTSASLPVGYILGGLSPQTGSVIFVKEITLTSLIDINVWVQITDYALVGNNAAPTITSVNVGPSYDAAIVPVNSFVREGETISFMLRTAVPSGGGTNTLDFRAGFHARRFTNDFAFEAPKTMLVIGDSISNTTGPTYGSEFYHSRVALHLKSIGKHYRRIVKGDGGWQASHAVYAMNRNWFDVTTPSLITIMLGTNDTVLANYQSNMTQLLTYLRANYPNSLICVFGPPPRQGTPENTLIILRDWAQSYVASLASANVIYTSLATAFDRTVDSNYVSSDGAGGTRVHPTGTAHGLMANSIISQWSSSGFIQKL